MSGKAHQLVQCQSYRLRGCLAYRICLRNVQGVQLHNSSVILSSAFICEFQHCTWSWQVVLVNRSGIMEITCACAMHRMYSCIRAIIFGEDFSSDPVSRALGLLVHLFSGGQVQIDTAIVAQVCYHIFLYNTLIGLSVWCLAKTKTCGNVFEYLWRVREGAVLPFACTTSRHWSKIDLLLAIWPVRFSERSQCFCSDLPASISVKAL